MTRRPVVTPPRFAFALTALLAAGPHLMGVRTGERTSLTIACVFVSAHVADVADYRPKTGELADAFVVACPRD